MAEPSASTRTGRRPGRSGTRERILQVARNQFADKGFDHTTIRSIAAESGVDSALVHHYFGTKQRLLVDAIELPLDPATILDALEDAPVDNLGEALARTVIEVWDSAHQTAVVAAVRSALTGTEQSLVRSFLLEVALKGIAARVDTPAGTGDLRVALVASQMTGMFVTRHLLRIDALRALTTERTVRLIAPTLQRYLTGPLEPN
ncbi:TetR family transcriptional regulator [Prescottella defluvii]|uniref:TetR/AcrR family transcriptional regulator n=1 Tax=Prescottella defluvii TaxID=1323361 RepID=UPI0004F28870|nr:TetR family transcriptional regulator [Prescottella defluvii]